MKHYPSGCGFGSSFRFCKGSGYQDIRGSGPGYGYSDNYWQGDGFGFGFYYGNGHDKYPIYQLTKSIK